MPASAPPPATEPAPTRSFLRLLLIHLGSVPPTTRKRAHPLLPLSSLGLILFLATTDTVCTPPSSIQPTDDGVPQTVVATSLPTILEALKAPESQYSWPGVAYLLPQTALQPLFPRFSDVLGRKARYVLVLVARAALLIPEC